MKKKIPVIIAFILTIALAVLFGHTTKACRIYDNNVNSVSYADLGVLSEGQTISQRFICKEDTIHGFLIKSSVAGNHGPATVHLELKDAATGETLAAADEPGTVIKARKIHYYKTGELTGLKGKELELIVSERGTTPGNGILMYYAVDSDAEYFAELDGSALGGVLPMATATERFDIETFVVFLLSIWFIWGFMWFLYRLFQ